MKRECKEALKVKKFLAGIVLVSLLFFWGSSYVMAKDYMVDSVKLHFLLDDKWIEHEDGSKPTFSEHNSDHVMIIDVVPPPGDKFQEFSQLGDDKAMQSFADSFIEAKKSANKNLEVLDYKVISFAKTKAIYSENILNDGKKKGYARSIFTVHDGKSVSITFITRTENNFHAFKRSAMDVLNNMTFTDLNGTKEKIDLFSPSGEAKSQADIKTEQNTNTKSPNLTKEKTSDEDSLRLQAIIGGYLWAAIKFAGIMLLFYGAKKLYKSFRKVDNNEDKFSQSLLKAEYEKQIEADLIVLNDKIEEAVKKLISQLRMPFVFQNFSDKEKAVILSDVTACIHFLCIKKIIDKQELLECRRLKFAHDLIINNMLNFLKENDLLSNNDINIEYEVMMEEYVKKDDKKLGELLNAKDEEVLCEKIMVVLMGHLGKMDLLADMDFRELLIKWYGSEVVPILKFYDESILFNALKYSNKLVGQQI